MGIALETSKGNSIDNVQVSDFSAYEKNWNQFLEREWQGQVTFKTSLTPIYNCHGMTFATRRCRITEAKDIDLILKDDQYKEVPEDDAQPGDIIIYFDENGEPNHSGIVIECSGGIIGSKCHRFVPLILSKWGGAGEAIHNAPQCPYGNVRRYYKCEL